MPNAHFVGHRYQLLEKIGQGGMGAVYRAHDRLTDTVVALKRLNVPADQLLFVSRPSTGDSTDFRLALAQEFKTAASLRHPNIISMYDYGFDTSGEIAETVQQPFFTMDLLENTQSIVKASAGLPFETRVDLLLQTLQALAYLHRRGILHRDLKPDNLQVGNGQVKVLDFGLAVARETLRGLEVTEHLAGTMEYMAPELLLDAPPSEASDLYALGVIAYEIFAGRHPFSAHNIGALIHDTLNATPPDLSAEVGSELAAVIARLLAKRPADRFDDANAVIEAVRGAVHLPHAPETSAIRESYLQAASFVGREAEFAQLEAGLMRILNPAEPQGSAWLVGGESGVGKSRLLDELRTHALVSGALVLRGQGVSDGGSLYALWREPLRRLCLEIELSHAEASVLKEVVPDIEALVGRRIPDAPELAPQVAQERLHTTVENVFRKQVKPLVLMLEDLQWASTESLALLNRISHHAAMQPLLIVASYRDDERPDLAELLPEMQLLKLVRLTRAGIAALIESMLGERGAHEEVIYLLERETEGNTFFIVEVMRALAEEAGQLEQIGATTLPQPVFSRGISRLLRRRLNLIADADHHLLLAAAVIGRQIDLNLLRSIAPPEMVDQWLTVCANAAVLENNDGWRFAHDKLRATLLADLTAEERRALHTTVALAIERVYPQADDYADALVHHWAGAQEPTREAFYARHVGEQALSSGAYQKAQTFLERALALEPDSQNGIARAHMRRALGETYYSLGDYVRARDLLADSAAVSETHGDSAGLARALNLSGNIALAMGDYTEARSLLEKSIQVSQTSGDLLELGKAMRSLGVIAETTGDQAQAKRLFQDSLALLTRVGDPLGMAGALANLASIARSEGDYLEARRSLELSLQQFESISFPWGIAYTATNLGVTMAALGETGDAIRLHERAITICREINHRWGTAFCLYNLAEVYVQEEEYEDARAALVEALNIAMGIQTVPLALMVITLFACLLVEDDEPERAVELVAFALEHPLVERETSEMGEHLLAQLRASFDQTMINAAHSRGALRSLPETVKVITG
jgi:tetratricopeptide (TPR) repeat protein